MRLITSSATSPHLYFCFQLNQFIKIFFMMNPFLKAIVVGTATTLIAMFIWAKFIAPSINKATPAPTA